MEYLRSFWKKAEQKIENPPGTSTSQDSEMSLSSNEHSECVDNVVQELVAPSTLPKHWDPKVVEFFKTFPEPYRQKAIERFSKRDGLYRYEIFRNIAMQEEMRAASGGVFKEDQREYYASLQQEKQEKLAEAWQKEKEMFETREIPEWEQKVLKFIPLQPGDEMWLKLVLATNFSAFGLAFLARWRSFQKSVPKPPRQKLARTFIGSAGICCLLQVCAVYRLMDWGPFDKSTDQRHYLIKVAEDLKRDFKMIQRHLEERPPKS